MTTTEDTGTGHALDDLFPSDLSATLRALLDPGEEPLVVVEPDDQDDVLTALVATRRCLVIIETPDDEFETTFVP